MIILSAMMRGHFKAMHGQCYTAAICVAEIVAALALSLVAGSFVLMVGYSLVGAISVILALRKMYKETE